MKMVSQLTRQAMSRHRLLTSAVNKESMYIPQPVPQTPSPSSLTQPPTQPAPSFSAVTPQPPASSLPIAPIRPAQPAPRPHTVYQQLMKSHDRMTERHL